MSCKCCLREKSVQSPILCFLGAKLLIFMPQEKSQCLESLEFRIGIFLPTCKGRGRQIQKKKRKGFVRCGSHIWDKLGQCSPATHEVPEVSLNNFPGILPSLSLPISLTEMQEGTSCSLVIIVFKVLAFFICIPHTLVLSLFQVSWTNDSWPLVLFLLNKTCRCVLLAP